MPEIVKLSEERVAHFDHDATAVHTVAPVVAAIRQLIPLRDHLTLLDVGGGNGTFLDRMLKAMPNTIGTLVERSEGMAEKNASSDRKIVVHADFLDWAGALTKSPTRYDVVIFNFVLHHFVGSNRSESIFLQQRALKAAQNILAEGGLMVIYEIHYNGLISDELPSRLIHALSSSHVLAPLTRLMGANTAGYGVCFHSERYWKSIFNQCGLRVVSEYLIENGKFTGLRQLAIRIGLNIGSMAYKVHFIQRASYY